MEKKLKEDWALSPGRVREFFLAQEDVESAGDAFIFKSCLISLEPASPGSFPWALERTLLSFSGESGDVEEIHRRFFLRFLSAGG